LTFDKLQPSNLLNTMFIKAIKIKYLNVENGHNKTEHKLYRYLHTCKKQTTIQPMIRLQQYLQFQVFSVLPNLIKQITLIILLSN
jgi:hypothetical protein